MGQAGALGGGFCGGGQQVQHLKLRRQMAGQRFDFLGGFSGHRFVPALLGELELAQQPGQFGQLVPLAHQAEQHFVDRIGIVGVGFRRGAAPGRHGDGGRSRPAAQAQAFHIVGIELGIGFHRFGDGFHHPQQVKREHTGGEHQVVPPQLAEPFQFGVAADRLRHRRQGDFGQVDGGVAQVSGQEGRHIFAEVGLYRQGHHIGGVKLLLGIHPEIDQGVAPGSLIIAAVKGQVHRVLSSRPIPPLP